MALPIRISEALDLGFSIIPTDVKTKAPSGMKSWTQYQSKAMTIEAAKKIFGRRKVGLGLICGEVSGGVECLDIDLKYDLSGTLYARLCIAIGKFDRELFDSLVIVETQNKGIHWWYKCPGEIGSDVKLAQRPATVEELAAFNRLPSTKKEVSDPNKLPKDLIDARGNGFYALIPPSKGYEIVQGDFRNIPIITKEQYLAIHRISKAFQLIMVKQVTAQKRVIKKVEVKQGAQLPGKSFDDAHGIVEVLEGYGWELVSNTRMKKPNGKSPSHAMIDQKTNKVFVHTDSCILPPKKGLTPYAVYTHYEHGGDFTQASRQLFKDGYGKVISTNYIAKPQPKEAAKKPVNKQKVIKPTPSANTDTNNNMALYSSKNPRFGDGGGFFELLGFDKSDSGVQAFYFFVNGSKSVIRLTAAKMSKANLMMLAPLWYWEETYPKGKSFNVDEVVNWLIVHSNIKGYYSGTNLRGRGAWTDEGRVVLHTGKKLVVDSVVMDLAAIESKSIYELGVSLSISTKDPLPETESKRLITLLERLNWDRPVDAYLLAGWLAIAPLCGALKWRSHVWITGAAGTGKSWVFKDVVRKMLGKVALAVQSLTTEAGLRQTLKNDAIPVVFDEAEGEDKKAQERMQGVLGLMRSASADDGGVLAKGTQTGTAMTFKMRSCFAYASIVPQQMQASDQRRITILELRGIKHNNDTRAKFAETERMRTELLTDSYVQRFQARMIRLLPQILESIEVFVSAISVALASRAMGDQLAPMLAGAWHCVSDLVVTPKAAKEFVEAYDWQTEADLEATTDELSCLQYILSRQIRIDTNGGVSRTLGELVNAVVHGDALFQGGPSVPLSHLQRIGLKVVDTETMLAISNTSPWLREQLKDTPWAKNHSRVLKRVDGATNSGGSIRFCTGLSTRATLIPLDKII